MKYWLLSVFVALIAYAAGCLKSSVLASNFIFHRNLRRLGSGNVLISNFRRLYGWKGAAELLAVELGLDLLPLLIGAMLFRSGDHGAVGAGLAGFCLVLGRAYPASYAYRGAHAIIPLVLTGFFLDFSIGVSLLLIALAALWFSRYFSLTALACALGLAVTAILVLDETLAVRLALLTAGVVLLRHLPAVPRLLNKTESKLSFEQDISYKFDERF